VVDHDRTLADKDIGFTLNRVVVRELELVSELEITLILATGRVLEDLPDKRVFRLFDYIVAENGGLIYSRETRRLIDLAPLDWFKTKNEIELRLKDLGISYTAGRNIISMKDFEGLDLLLQAQLPVKCCHIEKNAGDLMILPSGISKGQALAKIEKSDGAIVGIGDNTNDLKLFEAVDIRIAVANAEQALKDKADYVTALPQGDGVAEVLSMIRREQKPAWMVALLSKQAARELVNSL